MKHKTPLLIISALIIIVAGLFVYKNYFSNSDSAKIVDGTEDEENIDGLNSNMPVLLEFRTDSCPSCTQMEPILDEIMNKYDGIVEVRVLDVYENMTLANQYAVKVVPTLFILSAEGETLAGHEGILTIGQIEEAFKTYLDIEIQ